MPFDATPQVKTSVADVLRAGKANLPSHEHWYSRYGEGGERPAHCVGTAIGFKQNDALEVFARANGIPKIIHCSAVGIIEWNNARERKWADIHPAFDRAIALAEREGR